MYQVSDGHWVAYMFNVESLICPRVVCVEVASSSASGNRRSRTTGPFQRAVKRSTTSRPTTSIKPGTSILDRVHETTAAT